MISWTEGKPDAIEVGMVLKTKSGKTLVVGNVNSEGGQCDCCQSRAFYPETWESCDPIIAWTRLVLPKELAER
jgi:hypothetical protein